MRRLTLLAAATGWALYGLSILGFRSPDADVQAEIARLSQAAAEAAAERDALAAELAQFQEEHQDLQHLRKQIAATTQELQHLEYLRGRVSGQIDAIRPQPSNDPAQAADPQETTSPQVSPARSVETSASLSKEEIREAQEALTRLGYGQLEADGVFGPGTRRSVEAFQLAQGLSVTGRLDADTLRVLRSSQTAAQP
ncbi:peptidoglycan-binding domain-containing protein [Microvirga arabica]|uniref:peptidoglycan-binding domain-containing protein n=1 Tax=Microvirga arabica TaxID=1128671 RepID=UPI00366C60E0